MSPDAVRNRLPHFGTGAWFEMTTSTSTHVVGPAGSDLQSRLDLAAAPPRLRGVLFAAHAEIVDDIHVASRWLGEFHRAAQDAARSGAPLVVLVDQRDLLGQRGAASAVLATGLVSGVRAYAMEGARQGWSACVVAVDAHADDSRLIETLQFATTVRQDGGVLVVGHTLQGRVIP